MKKKKCLFLLAMIVAMTAVTVCNQSCKAWRTITTTSSYTASNDSTKSSITIQSKTVEEYQGVKKK